MDKVPAATTAKFEPETLNLFDEVDSASARINKQRPFTPEIQLRLSREFIPDRVTASLNMEGISVSRRQTLLMMDAMTLTENNSKAEVEIYNALKADEVVYDFAKSNHPITASVVREINQVLQEGVLESAGQFRRKDVEITGAAFQPPSHGEVMRLISEMASGFEDSIGMHAIFRAAWLHSTFTRIHPFEDGNGRTGRLLQDMVLISNGLFPTGIPSSLRDDYYDALERADDGDWNPLCQMICQLELKTLSKVQAVLEDVKTNEDFISGLSKRAAEKKSGGLHKQYIVWQQRMQNFADQLEATCDDLDASSDVIGVQTERYDPIDFNKWQEISKVGRASNTWFMKQTWFSEGTAFFRTILFFSRHFFRPSTDIHQRDDLYGTVSLYMAGGSPAFGAKYDFMGFDDADIRFRELFFVDDEAFVYHGTGELEVLSGRKQEKWTCEKVDKMSMVINGLVEDMFVRKLGI